MGIEIYDAADVLSKVEVQELTGLKHRDAQCLELEKMGIPFFKRRNGSPVVPRRFQINSEDRASAGPGIDMVEFESRVKG